MRGRSASDALAAPPELWRARGRLRPARPSSGPDLPGAEALLSARGTPDHGPPRRLAARALVTVSRVERGDSTGRVDAARGPTWSGGDRRAAAGRLRRPRDRRRDAPHRGTRLRRLLDSRQRHRAAHGHDLPGANTLVSLTFRGARLGHAACDQGRDRRPGGLVGVTVWLLSRSCPPRTPCWPARPCWSSRSPSWLSGSPAISGATPARGRPGVRAGLGPAGPVQVELQPRAGRWCARRLAAGRRGRRGDLAVIFALGPLVDLTAGLLRLHVEQDSHRLSR